LTMFPNCYVYYKIQAWWFLKMLCWTFKILETLQKLQWPL
jgi:hypothetical protein